MSYEYALIEEREVRKSRRARCCDWCGQRIEIGQPYNRERFASEGDAFSRDWHPECRKMMLLEASLEPGGYLEWEYGAQERPKAEE